MGLLNAILGNAGASDPESLQKEFAQILIRGENVESGFRLVRDVFIFTDARLILVDVQGLSGKKVEYLSLPYRSISRFSVETAGTFDLDAELKIWVSSEPSPSIQKRFNRSVNIYELQRFLAYYVLRGEREVVFGPPPKRTDAPPPAATSGGSDGVDDVPMR